MAQTDKQKIINYIGQVSDNLSLEEIISDVSYNLLPKRAAKLTLKPLNPKLDDELFSPKWHKTNFKCGDKGYIGYKSSSYRIKEAWLFRGMQDSNWSLETTFERRMKQHKTITKNWKSREVNSLSEHEQRKLTAFLVKAEQKMLDNFKRYAYSVFDRLPDEVEREEWLALMQHYEVATRLLDWTYSFYVALFFAVEQLSFETNRQKKTCSVWAIKSNAVVEKSFDNFKNFQGKSKNPSEKEKESKRVKNVLAQYHADGLKKIGGRFIPIFEIADQLKIDGIFHISPLIQNKRLRNQQGTFLVPLNLHKTFEETLISLNIGQNTNLKKIDITLNKEQQQQILKTLHSMNINHSTVYPDIKGYGQHINTMALLEHPYTPIS